MGLGIRMRKLWQLRKGVLVCVAVALLAALWSVERISLVPPGLSPRALEMATASTQVVVDTPESGLLLDLREDQYLESLTDRAVVLGNVMTIGRVRASIARRVGIPTEALQVSPPLTPKQPRGLAEVGNDRHVSDVLKLNDQYRLNVQANPTVPVLYIYAQTPTAASAEALANAAVDAMRGYLADLARSTDTRETERVHLVQVGRARGEVINAGIDWQAAVLAFLLTFAASCATLIFVARVRDGWRTAAATEWATER
jgi:hypothetical protein